MGILAHCTSRFSSSKYKDIFNSGKQAVHFLPLFLSLHLRCRGLKQGPHCSSTAELHPQPFSLRLHVSVYCFPYHVFMSVLYREGRRHYPKSLRGWKLLSPHCWLLTERAGLSLIHVGISIYNFSCSPHSRVETLLLRSNQKVITAILNTFRTELNWILSFRDFNQL